MEINQEVVVVMWVTLGERLKRIHAGLHSVQSLSDLWPGALDTDSAHHNITTASIMADVCERGMSA